MSSSAGRAAAVSTRTAFATTVPARRSTITWSTLLRRHALRFDTAYLAMQSFLSPHPNELMLRSYV
jgi:uncharacterized protein YbgA (DUF1722 family)